jgi:hypothetical protein
LRVCAQGNDDAALAAGLALQCEIWDYDTFSRFLESPLHSAFRLLIY